MPPVTPCRRATNRARGQSGNCAFPDSTRVVPLLWLGVEATPAVPDEAGRIARRLRDGKASGAVCHDG